MSSEPAAVKNHFVNIGNWTPDKLKNLQVIIGPIKETTSSFTKKNSGENHRYWKAPIEFKYENMTSKVIKMAAVHVPYVEKQNYGKSYVMASLQRAIGDAIVKAGIASDITITLDSGNIKNPKESWWATINGIDGKVGIANGKADFVTTDLYSVFDRTNKKGVVANLDLVFHIKFATDDSSDRNNKSTFTIAADCSRMVLLTVGVPDMPSPPIDSVVPMQALSKQDVASQELVTQLMQLGLIQQ